MWNNNSHTDLTQKALKSLPSNVNPFPIPTLFSMPEGFLRYFCSFKFGKSAAYRYGSDENIRTV